ncbi:MAG: 3-isopropylmalate dehydratase small subunit [Oceanococcus sp.]
MDAFTQHTGKVLPMDRSNVDTDAIIPKQFLKSIRRTGFGPFLFDDWRYLDEGTLETPVESRRINPDFELNDARFAGASVLLARKNFGCGSSREHAVWALENYGIRCVIAPSFADIFFNNCFKNGVLPIVLKEEGVDRLFSQCADGAQLSVDLPAQTIIAPNGDKMPFDIDAGRKSRLVQGLDDIGLTLGKADAIRSFEEKHRAQQPWLFTDGI